MTDEPIYDPDRMVFEDLDLSDPGLVEAYLDHDVTKALAGDLGRSTQNLPAAEQRTVLEEELRSNDTRRAEVAQTIEMLDRGDPARAHLEQLLDELDEFGAAVQRRLLELHAQD